MVETEMPESTPETEAYDAREEAYACLDALDDAPVHERPRLITRAIRADPTLIDGYLEAARNSPKGRTESATAWLAVRELARLQAGVPLDTGDGDLWSRLSARPYLRACAGYAACCFERREYDLAIAECRSLLVLDAEDHLEAAPLLGAALLLSGDLPGYESLRETSKADVRPQWLYVDAFHAASAKLPAATRNPRIDRAIRSNPYVPQLLLSAETDANGIDHYAPGSAEEAVVIAASGPGGLWRTRPAALRLLVRRAHTLAD